MGQPKMINDNLLMRLESLDEFAFGVVPKDDVARSVAGGDVTTVWGESDRAGVAGCRVTGKTFLA